MESTRREIEQDMEQRLFVMQDKGYQEFQAKLIPTVAKDRVIGVRIPALRKFTKEYAKSQQAAEFIKILPHRYYEEDNVHAFLIEGMKDYDACVAALDVFLPYVDNWATCDCMSPKIFKKHLPELLETIKRWICAEDIYTVRFGIGMLMKFYLDEAFKPEYLAWVAEVHSQEYYINMMIAWYFATALAKQYEATLPYIEEGRLDKDPHNKAIQKAVESYRISDEQKAYLKTFKIK